MDSKIFDTLLEPTFVLNENKCILYCNEAAAVICDVSARKIQRSKPALDQIFIFAEKIIGLDQLISVQEPTAYQEVRFQTESGKMGKAQITIQDFAQNTEQKQWLVYFRDVTLEETLQQKYRAELGQKEDVILHLQKAQAELKNYSENLEKMVEQRTVEIARMNQTMRALLDSLSQGFFIFDKQGTCLPVYSKACESTIQTIPAGKKIWEVMKTPANKVEGFQKWLMALFQEMLPFPDMVAIGPQKYPHSEGLTVQIEYYPLRDQHHSLEAVVVVATDITALIQAQTEAETEKAHAKMILSLIKNKRAFASFLREANVLIAHLQREMNKSEFDQENTFRLLHTMKGGAATFSFKNLAEQCHEAETLLSTWKEHPSRENFFKLKEATLKIPFIYQKYLEQNSEIIGNLNKLERTTEVAFSQFLNFEQYIQHDKKLLQKYYDQFIMEPIGQFFHSFDEATQQVAQTEGKSIAPLAFKNPVLKIIPEPYEGLFSTFIHAYRNAADHGIEIAQERLAKGKLAVGTITTEFSIVHLQQQEFLQIHIHDDGGGIAPEKIKARLLAKGLPVENETEQQILQHVFDSQFSTKESVSEISGRGVGMDAILQSAKNLGGTAWVESQKDQGTSLYVQVPYFRYYRDLKSKTQAKKTAS